MRLSKKLAFLSMGIVFLVMTTVGGNCEDLGGTPYDPVDPLFTNYVAVGDSITQGVMSGDANSFTQGRAYPVHLGGKMHTKMVIPFMVSEQDPDPTDSFPYPAGKGFHRLTPGIFANNIGVSGMDVALSTVPAGNERSYADHARTTALPANDGFVDELDAVLAPHDVGDTAQDVTQTLKPTFVTFWLGNNDALGAVAQTGSNPSSLSQNLSNINEGGLNYQNNFVALFPSSTQSSIFAGKLDNSDPRGPNVGYNIQERIAQTGSPHNFQTKYTNAIDAVLGIDPNLKMVVLNIPDVTSIAHLFTFQEAKQFFIRYAQDNLTQSELDAVWGTTGFAGDSTALVPLDIMILGLKLYKGLRDGGQTKTNALALICRGEGIGSSGTSGTNNALFDWDVNHIGSNDDDDDDGTADTDELAIVNGLVNALNTVINNVVTDSSRVDRIAFFDVNSFFDTIQTSGIRITDGAGNPITSYLGNPVQPLSRIYPGAGNPTATNGNETNGGIFSLDGVHPGPTAHAILTNKLIEAINSKFGTSLQRVNELEAWINDPFVDHDLDGYVVGFPFTRSSDAIGENVILRDPDDSDPNETP